MNRVIIQGRITKDVELRHTQTGTAIAKLNVAVRRKLKNKEGKYDSDFVNCIAYNQLGETISKYFKKGNRIAIEGRLQSGSYTNQKGDKIYTTDVVIDEVEFIDEKPKEETQTEIVKQAMSDDPYTAMGMKVEQSELPF